MASRVSSDVTRIARWFPALVDSTRVQIMERLVDGEQCVCDLTDALQTSQSLLSFHLKTLKDAGLIHGRRVGRWVYYVIDSDALEEIQDVVRSLNARHTPLTRSARCRDRLFLA